MVHLNKDYLYAKGTCNVVVRDITTGNVDYQSNKVQTNQFQTTVDMGAIQAGIGNAVAINIPHNANASLTLTSADFDMAVRAMSVGARLEYGGIAPECEVVTATSAHLQVSKTPAAPFGFSQPICNVTAVGASDATNSLSFVLAADGTVENFVAVIGKQYVVTYFTRNASSQYFNIGGAFAPAVKHVTVQVAVYSTKGTQNANQGTKVGDLYIIIPRMQFSGKADIDGSQTGNAPTDLSGTALTYDEASQVGVCADCAIPGLAQVMYVPTAGTTSAVQGMAVVGGAVNMTAGTTAKLPVKWIMPNNTLIQPDYTAMNYVIPTNGSSVASVDETGLISAIGEGSTSITATLMENPEITCTADINVVAAN